VPVTSEVVPLRERRRAETINEIKDAALAELADAGPGGMSLRGVARAMGMSVQSLYHYFDNRDALLTELVVDSHNQLADAVERSVVQSRGLPPVERRLRANLAYRAWALEHRPAFLLIFGTPVPGFQPAPDGRTAAAAYRLGEPFVDVVFDGWTPAQLAAVPLLPGADDMAVLGAEQWLLPPGALALFIELRGRLHGLVMLDLLHHLHPLQDYGRQLFIGASRRMSDDIDRLQRAA